MEKQVILIYILLVIIVILFALLLFLSCLLLIIVDKKSLISIYVNLKNNNLIRKYKVIFLSFFNYPIHQIHYIYLALNHQFINKKKLQELMSYKVVGEKFNPSKKLFVYLALNNRLNELPCKSLFKYFKNHDYTFFLIVNGEANEKSVLKFMSENSIPTALIRKNYGYDFGAYKYFLDKYVKYNQDSYDEIIFMNDSTYFPAVNPGNFFLWLKKPREFGAALYNYGDGNVHLQSFFMQFKTSKGIRSLVDFFDLYRPYNSRIHAINRGEKALSIFFQKNGIRLDSFVDLSWLFNTNDETRDLVLNFFDKNLTHHAPVSLMKLGFPFLKYDIFTKKINYISVLNFLPYIICDVDREAFNKYILSVTNFNGRKSFLYKFLLFYGFR